MYPWHLSPYDERAIHQAQDLTPIERRTSAILRTSAPQSIDPHPLAPRGGGPGETSS
jgi:hypothetical protein